MSQAVKGLLQAALQLTPAEQRELAQALCAASVVREKFDIPDWHDRVLEAVLAEPDDDLHTVPLESAVSRLASAIRRAREA